MKNPLRSLPVRIVVCALLLGAVYWWSYSQGIVSEFTDRMGWSDPGQLHWDTPSLGSAHPDTPATGDAAAAADLAVSIPIATSMATGYQRENFTAGWASLDGCDMRNRVLARDLRDVELVAGQSCQVASGTLVDPYSGAQVSFVRGKTTSSAVQIDHVVSLAAAWRLGASTWPPAEREKFANDPANLLATDGPTNARKSDKTLAEFGQATPLTDAGACTLTITYVNVTAAYGLSWTSQDAQYAAQVLPTC